MQLLIAQRKILKPKAKNKWHLLRSEHTEKRTSVYRCSFFSYIRLRRVILLRSDIRLTPSDIRFASSRGEYNITARRCLAISLPVREISLFALAKNITFSTNRKRDNKSVHSQNVLSFLLVFSLEL